MATMFALFCVCVYSWWVKKLWIVDLTSKWTVQKWKINWSKTVYSLFMAIITFSLINSKKPVSPNLTQFDKWPVLSMPLSSLVVANMAIIPDGQSDSSTPTTAAAAAAQVIAPSQAPPPQIEPFSRGQPKVFNQIEYTPIKDYSRPDSWFDSTLNHPWQGTIKAFWMKGLSVL